MFTRIMKWLSIMALLLGVFLSSSASYRTALELVVCVAAAVVAAQAFRTGKYFWGVGFTAVAVLFNPVIPVAFSPRTSFWLDLTCLVAFVASLAALKTMPVMSIPSITARRSRGESL